MGSIFSISAIGGRFLVDGATFVVAYYSSRPIHQVKVVFPSTGNPVCTGNDFIPSHRVEISGACYHLILSVLGKVFSLNL